MLKADLLYHFVRGSLQVGLETTFQQCAGKGGGIDDVGHTDLGEGIGSNETNCRCNLRVIDRDQIGRFSSRDSRGFNEVAFCPGLFSCHNLIQKDCGLISGLLWIWNDTGEWGIAKFAEEVVIVLSDDSNFVGYFEAELPASIEELLTADVIACHDADRLWEAFEPGSKLPLLGEGVAAVGFVGLKSEAPFAVLPGFMGKVFSVLICPGKAGITTVCKISEAPVVKVFEGESCHGLAVADDRGNAICQSRCTDVQDGNAFLANCELRFRFHDSRCER